MKGNFDFFFTSIFHDYRLRHHGRNSIWWQSSNRYR